MKNTIYLTGLFILIVSITSCDKNFLEKKPLDEISSEIYFKKTADLRLYMNQFYQPHLLEYGGEGTDNYSQLIFLADLNSDNMIDESFDERLNGTRVVPASGGGWNYDNVRAINYFFENYKKCQDKFESYQHYLGEAFFFRASIYYLLVQQFGDVQWYNKVLTTNSPELYDARTPRNVVVDHIISDLDSAAMYLDLESSDGGNRLNRGSALTLQSRVALYEGTWEKYHAGTVFGVQNPDPQKYLNKATLAASEVINSDQFSIYSTGKPDEDYFNLFDIHDYAGNSEVILWKKFDKALNIINYRMVLGEWPRGYGITKALADSYLCDDGLPIAVSPLFQGQNSLAEVSQNRDPRFKQTIFTQDAPYAFAGTVYADWNEGVYSKLFTDVTLSSPTCYIMRKGTTTDLSKQNYGGEDEPIILFDYAEVLLNYAEAKAELGTITQADINLSIKPLRDRVGMPNIVLTSIVTDPNWEFPALSPIINEIRRERRVELACVGFRWNDIARWAAADILIAGKRPKGSQFGSDFIPLSPYLDDANGFMDPYISQVPGGYAFDLGRDYLDPLPQSELTLNDKLTQNPGWE
jgi:starch-binding outer membrane protein, SusD/RagB family